MVFSLRHSELSMTVTFNTCLISCCNVKRDHTFQNIYLLQAEGSCQKYHAPHVENSEKDAGRSLQGSHLLLGRS